MTVTGADQLDLLPWITLAVTFLFHPVPIDNVSWQLGKVYVRQVQIFPVSIDILVRGAVPIEVSSHANCDSYSFKSASSVAFMYGLILWHGGSNVSSSTCSDIIFLVVTLFIVWAPEFS